MRILSWTLSILLHACVALAATYLATPDSMLVDLSVPVYQVELVNLVPRKGRPAVKAPAKPAVEKPAPKPKAEPVAAKPEPAPKPEAKAIAAKVEKPEKPEVTEIAKKAPEKPAPPKKPQKTKKQLLAEALAQAQKDAKWLERKERKRQEREAAERRKALDEALAQAEADAALADAKDEAVGAGGDAEDGAMLGLREIYAAQVKEIIKANWRYPSIPVDASLAAGVFIRVGPAGHITEYSLLARSGRPDFDESVLKAVEETEVLPPPPGDITEIRINFNLQDMR